MADVAKNRAGKDDNVAEKGPSLLKLFLSSWIFLPPRDRICDATETGNSCFPVFVRDERILSLKEKLFFDSDADIIFFDFIYIYIYIVYTHTHTHTSENMV